MRPVPDREDGYAHPRAPRNRLISFEPHLATCRAGYGLFR